MKPFPRMWLFHITMAILAAAMLYTAFSTAPAAPEATDLAMQCMETTAKTWRLDGIITNSAPVNVLDMQTLFAQSQTLPEQLGAFKYLESFVGRGGKISPKDNKADVRQAATFKADAVYDKGIAEISLTAIQIPDGKWKVFNFEIKNAKYMASGSTNLSVLPKATP